MQQFRRLTVLIAVAAVLGSCAVHESTRGGGLVPPTGPAVTAAAPAPTVVTVTTGAPIAAALSGTVQPPQTASAAGSPQPAITKTTADGNDAALPPPTVASAVLGPATTDGDSPAHVRDVLATAEPPAGFGEGVLGVSGPTGMQVWPVIIADTSQARRRGLMGVTDFAAMGGYAAMVFIFEGDTSGAFWMRDTPLPLRITFVAADGSVVSGTDMAPCLAPTPSNECERYLPAGPYRYAIEHPIGAAFDIGLADADLVEVTVE